MKEYIIFNMVPGNDAKYGELQRFKVFSENELKEYIAENPQHASNVFEIKKAPVGVRTVVTV